MDVTILFGFFLVFPAFQASNVVKQWSVGNNLAFLGIMRDECLKDGSGCKEGFTIAAWLKTSDGEERPSPPNAPVSGDSDRRDVVAYLVSNGGQSPNSNGFYFRRLTAPRRYEIGVTNGFQIWRIFFYLKSSQQVHVVFSWQPEMGLAVYVDGLLAAHEMKPSNREYLGSENVTSDPYPQFVANGDSLLFRQLFDEATFLPVFDLDGYGEVINVTYFHKWKSDEQVGELLFDYDNRLEAGCFFEIPFGGELVSPLANFSTHLALPREYQVKLAYFKCRNDCIAKKSPSEPWTVWLAIVDPRTLNCFCMLAELYTKSSHKLDSTKCTNSMRQTRAQFTSVALDKPPMTEESEPSLPKSSFQFSLIVPSMTCFFVVSGKFGTYAKAEAACTRRGAQLANLESEIDENFILTQLNWSPIAGLKDNVTDYLLWTKSTGKAEEGTCNFCSELDESCTFVTNRHRKRIDCHGVTIANDSANVIGAVGALCQRLAFDLPTDPMVGKGFCGVPAISTQSLNTFITAGEIVKRFYVLPGRMSWDDAFEACKTSKWKGRLASIRSPEENNAVQKQLHQIWAKRTDADAMEPVWIGARRVAPHRPSFVWLDGTPVVFTAWVIGEPNNAIEKSVPDGIKGEECVGVWPNWSSENLSRAWNDFHCFENRTMNFGALCEVF